MKSRLTARQIVQVYKLHKDGISFRDIGDEMGIPWKTASSCWYVLHKNWSNRYLMRHSYKKALGIIRGNCMNRKDKDLNPPTTTKAEIDMLMAGKAKQEELQILDPNNPVDAALIKLRKELKQINDAHWKQYDDLHKAYEKLKEFEKYEPIINALEAIAASRKE